MGFSAISATAGSGLRPGGSKGQKGVQVWTENPQIGLYFGDADCPYAGYSTLDRMLTGACGSHQSISVERSFQKQFFLGHESAPLLPLILQRVGQV
jgi:hypothetical protein